MNSKMASYEETCEYCKCFYPIGCFGGGMERSIVQNLVRNMIKINEGDERMWGQNKSFPFGIL